jgi:hypothetical protein
VVFLLLLCQRLDVFVTAGTVTGMRSREIAESKSELGPEGLRARWTEVRVGPKGMRMRWNRVQEDWSPRWNEQEIAEYSNINPKEIGVHRSCSYILVSVRG